MSCLTVWGNILKFKVNQILSSCLILLILCGAHSAFSSTFTVYEHIALTQNLSVSAHRLCQDGLYIYFKSEQDCLNSKGPFVCDQELKIAPIRSVEKIFLGVGAQSLTRFYEIHLRFRQRVYFSSENSEDELIQESIESIPYCVGYQIYQSANVGSWRYVETDEEADIIESFISSGINLINTPFGGLQFFKNMIPVLNAKDHFFEELPRFKSPYCNKDLTHDAIKQMSGEFSGNGIMGFKINELQDLSREIYIKKTNTLFEPEINKVSADYQLSCQETLEI